MSSDEGYREIQLNGKQMIFLFMATTIVAVVIFLCGVTVGRGVRNAAPAVGAEPAVGTSPAVDIAAVPTETPGAAKPVEGPPPAAVPPAPPSDPTGANAYDNASAEAAGAPPAPGGKRPAGSARVPAAPALAAAPVSTAAAPPSSEPAGEGFVVQVEALSDRNQAEARAKALVAKGYPAYVVPPPSAGGMFRVRVGKFKERRQAEDVMRRLIKEEKARPFIPAIR